MGISRERSRRFEAVAGPSRPRARGAGRARRFDMSYGGAVACATRWGRLILSQAEKARRGRDHDLGEVLEVDRVERRGEGIGVADARAASSPESMTAAHAIPPGVAGTTSVEHTSSRAARPARTSTRGSEPAVRGHDQDVWTLRHGQLGTA